MGDEKEWGVTDQLKCLQIYRRIVQSDSVAKRDCCGTIFKSSISRIAGMSFFLYGTSR